jgi:tRNA A-37 threonylcarbamoyl transferase component Bud32
LQALHAHGKKGIMHRDLHMGNILVKGGEAKLSDLGLSKICDSG